MPSHKVTFHYFYQCLLRIALVLLLFSVCRLAFYLFNQNSFPDSSFLELSNVFLHGLRFDLCSIVYINILVILSYLLPLPWRDRSWYQRIQKIIFLFCNGVAIFIEAIDIGFFQFAFRRSLPSDAQMFNTATNLTNRILKEYWYFFVIFFFLMLFISYLYKKTSLTTLKEKAAIWTQLVVFIFGLGLFIIAARGGLQLRPIMPISAASYVNDMRMIPVMTNTNLGLIFSTQQRQLKPKNYFSREEAAAIFPTQKTGELDSTFQAKNVFLIVLESFGKEYIGYYNEGESYTPFLDSLLTLGWQSNNSFANGMRSTQAIAAITAGIPAMMEDPLMFSAYQGNKVEGIAALLKKKGYTSGFFHGANEGSMEFERFSKITGYDAYHDRRSYNNDADYDGNWGIWDAPFFDYTIDEVNTWSAPFFATLFSINSHHPYNVEKWFEEKYPDMDILDRTVKYADYALQQFFKKAQQQDWFDETLFVICADHIGMNRVKSYKTKVRQYSVPILFYDPGNIQAEVSNQLIQQTDILPSVMDYLNYDLPYSSFGTSIFEPTDQRYAFMLDGIYQIVDEEYILFFNEEESVGLYQFNQDPSLKNNLLETLPAVRDRLERKLKAVIQVHHRGMIYNSLSGKAE